MTNVLPPRNHARHNNAKTILIHEDGAGAVVDELLALNIVLLEDWEALRPQIQERILMCTSRNDAIHCLQDENLLTEYQADRVRAGTTFGLVLGSYRVLSRIGAGGMAVVFKAEHVDLRQLVAIKVLPMYAGQDARLESRFFAEMRIVAQLRHPNIVVATDAGRAINPDAHGPSLRYLVMEYVPGQNLEDCVRNSGPMPIARACNYAFQIASALSETHKFHLVHRDIKPSNIMVTPEEQVKLLDFGLSRRFDNRLTSPGTVLGTIDFMAPEQARDASAVDVRADLYSLGGVLYWSLTGQLPFGNTSSPVEALARRITQLPPLLRRHLPNCPIELDEVLQRLMATNPEHRYQTPQAFMQAIWPFLQTEEREQPPLAPCRLSVNQACSKVAVSGTQRILIVDDEAEIRQFCRHVLEADHLACDEAANAASAVTAASAQSYDLVLLDVHMPGLTCGEALKRLRQPGCGEHLKIIVFSGQASADEMARMLQQGADEYLTKPFSVAQLRARVRATLQLKIAQDRALSVGQELLDLRQDLKMQLEARENDMHETQNALVMSLSRLVDERDGRDRNHSPRLQRFCRALAEAAAKSPHFEAQIDQQFIEALETVAPLHDAGKIVLPDHVLLKGGTLCLEERLLMQTHTSIAADAIQDVVDKFPAAAGFLRLAMDVIRHHHEHYDGTGYPDQLAGDKIPLAARIVAIADVYDALRGRRAWKPALAHVTAVQIMTQASLGHFDPQLLEVFREIHPKFEAIFKEFPDASKRARA